MTEYVPRSQINERALLEILANSEPIKALDISRKWYELGLPMSALERTKKELRKKGFEIDVVRRKGDWYWQLVGQKEPYIKVGNGYWWKFEVPNEAYEALSREANRRGIGLSSLLPMIVAEYLEHHPITEEVKDGGR